jgi:hypothetical protein
MATQKEVLEVIQSKPDGFTLAELAEHFAIKPFALTKTLSDLKKKGSVTHEGELYKVAAEGTEKPPAQVPLPSDFDEFRKIGESIGITGDFLENIGTFVFRTDPYSIEAVLSALQSLHLRPDTIPRWTTMWAAAIGKPLPAKVAEVITPATTTTTMGSKEAKHYSVFGQQIVIDPSGPYDSVIDAQRELALRLQPAQPAGGSQEMTTIREELKTIREVMVSQQFNVLKEGLATTNQRLDNLGREKGEASRFGVLQTGVDRVGTELSGWRSDIKSLVPQFLARGQTIKRRTEQEKERFSQGLDGAIEQDKKTRKMEEALWPELKNMGQQGVVVAPSMVSRTSEASRPPCYVSGYVSGRVTCVDRRDDPACHQCSYASQ